MNSKQRYTIWAAASILLLGLLGVAQGQETPLAIGNAEPVVDILGRPFPGDLNGPSNEACRVEVREVGDGIVAPDPVTGEGNDAVNPILFVTRIGQVVIGQDTGKFSTNLSGRLPQGVVYFARVYDASTPGAAYYYANSVAFEDVPPEEFLTTPTMDVVFQGLNLVNQGDDTDSDGDLLPDWMELDLTSTDPNAWDSDEDGYYDGFEVLHDTYLENGVENINEIILNAPGEPLPSTNEYYVSWWSIPGVAYQLEYRDVMTNGVAFTNLWDVTAGSTNTEISVYWVTNAGVKGFFRYLIP